MAGGYSGQLVALDVDSPSFDASTPLLAANQITAGSITNQTNALSLQNQVMQRNALLDYYKSVRGGQPAATTSPLSSVSPSAITAPPPTPAMLISGAASKATDADSWDASMASLQKQGVAEAGQFIGRYTPKLQQQVIGAYAPAPAPPLPANGNAGPSSPLGAVGAPDGAASSPLSASGGPAGVAPASPLAAGPAGSAGGAGGSPLAMLGILNPTAASNIANLQARLKYSQSGDINDLRVDPQAMASVATATKDMTDSQKTKFTMAADAAGRAANAALTIPAGPQRDAYMKQAYANMQKNGLVPPDSEPHDGPITDDVLQHIITQSMTVDQAMQASGQTAGNIARAQLPSELAKIGATGAQARLTQAVAPYTLEPGAERYAPGRGVIAGSGAGPAGPASPLSAVSPAGGTTAAPPFSASPLAAAPAAAGGTLAATPIATGQNPGIIAGQKAQAEQFVKYQGDLADSAAKAITSNNDWDQMRAESQTWQQGKFADSIGDAKSYLSSMAQQVGLPPGKYADQVGDWQAFTKNAGALLRDAAHAVSPRVGVQEMQLVAKSLPSAEMSKPAFQQIADQMQGINDFTVAKNAAAANFQGTQPAFEAEFNKNVSPLAFVVNRMSPSDYVTFSNNLKKTDAGRQELAKIVNSMQYADKNGLFSALGQ